jgi:hypothetical protein
MKRKRKISPAEYRILAMLKGSPDGVTAYCFSTLHGIKREALNQLETDGLVRGHLEYFRVGFQETRFHLTARGRDAMLDARP